MKNIRYCPRCKSVNVRISITPSAVLGAPQKWQCLNCGFESYSVFPIGKIEDQKKIQKDIKEKKVKKK